MSSGTIVAATQSLVTPCAVGRYNDKLMKLAEAVLREVVDFKVEEDRFQVSGLKWCVCVVHAIRFSMQNLGLLGCVCVIHAIRLSTENLGMNSLSSCGINKTFVYSTRLLCPIILLCGTQTIANFRHQIGILCLHHKGMNRKSNSCCSVPVSALYTSPCVCSLEGESLLHSSCHTQ